MHDDKTIRDGGWGMPFIVHCVGDLNLQRLPNEVLADYSVGLSAVIIHVPFVRCF